MIYIQCGYKIEKLLEESQKFKKGVYIEAIPDPMDVQKIWAHLKKIGIPLMPPNKAHVTIIYSNKPFSGKIKIKDKIITAKPKAFRIFGRGTPSSPYALVLELDSPDLISLHKYYMKKYPFKYDFPEYIPHITLTYDIGNIMPGLKKLKPKQMKTIENIFNRLVPELPPRIKLIKQKVSELNIDWSP